MSNKKTSNLETRANVIKYIYKFQLFNTPLNSIFAFESGDFSNVEIKLIETIEKNYKKLNMLVQKFTNKKWSWERIAPLERAILVYGAFELSIKDAPLVINELIIITQGYIPGDSYKFINGTLDRIGHFYAKLKNN